MSVALRPYRPFEAIGATLARHGAPFRFGRSVQGRPLWGVEIGTTGPRLLVTAGLHGLEYVGVEVALAVLAAGPIAGARLVVLPVLNPDGYVRTWRHGGQDRVASLRKNARGVDLNRNFPLPWGARPSRILFAGSDRPTAATYRGPHPLSEPESYALTRLLHEDPPLASVNLHSFMGTQITPKVLHREDWQAYTTLCAAFREAQGPPGYPRLATPLGDVFTGELEDYQHHVLGCWAACIECFTVGESLAQHLRAPSPFWRFNPHNPEPIVQRDAAGTRAWLTAALRLGPAPRRPGSAPSQRALPVLP